MLLLLIILIIAAGLILTVSFVTYRLAFYNANRIPDDPHRVPEGPKYDCLSAEIHPLIDDTLSLPYREIRIVSRDGLNLYAKLYSPDCIKNPEKFLSASWHPSENTTNTVSILMHGWHGIAERDFAAGVQIHLSHGDTVILADERAHNKSSGHTITFGIKERYDLLDWINYAIDSFGSDVNLIIHGVSMGAATVLMTSGLSLPANVKGVIADSPYTSAKEIISKIMNEKGIKANCVYPFVKLGALIFGHFDPDCAASVSAVKKNHLPVLFIHGTGDDFVPYEMSCRLYEAANTPKLMLTVENAPHVMSYLYDKERYYESMDRFYRMVRQQASSHSR